MNSIVKNRKKNELFFISLFFSIIFIFPATAFEGAILKEIIIGSKDNYGYKIVLKTNKNASVEKNTTSDNRIVINLKNTRTAEHVNTIYDNTPEIENVFVQSLAQNKVRIFIEGLNIASSKIILDTENKPTILQKPVNLPINNHVNSSAVEKIKTTDNMPVIDLSNNVVNEPQPAVNNNVVRTYQNNFSVGKREASEEIIDESVVADITLKQIFGKETFDLLIRIFAVIFIIIGIVKLLTKSKNVTFDLSTENIKEKETAYDKKELLTKSLGGTLSEKIRTQKKQYSANTNYGIKEYQNSNNRPVRQKSDRPTDNINTKLNKTNKFNSALKTTKTPVENKRPPVNRMKATQRDMKTAENNFDNVKFLETMATIYQKSGRIDLAKNIRQNIINKAS